MQEITVQQLKSMMDAKEDFQLIDVREEYENDICTIGGLIISLLFFFRKTYKKFSIDNMGINVDDKKYFHALKQGYKTNLETEAPVYNQILQQEQIELHKLMMLVQANNGTVLDVNTDAVSCIFEGDKFLLH